MPRPTKLTPELQNTIARYVNAGANVPRACVAAGLSWNTAKEWLARGRAGDEPYADFVHAIEQAKAAWAVGIAMRITSAGKQDWKADAWAAERRLKEYAPPTVRSQINVEVDAQYRALLTLLEGEISPSAYAEVLAALAKNKNGELALP